MIIFNEQHRLALPARRSWFTDFPCLINWKFVFSGSYWKLQVLSPVITLQKHSSRTKNQMKCQASAVFGHESKSSLLFLYLNSAIPQYAPNRLSYLTTFWTADMLFSPMSAIIETEGRGEYDSHSRNFIFGPRTLQISCIHVKCKMCRIYTVFLFPWHNDIIIKIIAGDAFYVRLIAIVVCFYTHVNRIKCIRVYKHI